MNVADPTQVFLDVVSRRRSMRDFKPDPVPREIIESVFGTAQRAPSNCNTQPWFVHVVTGEKLERLREAPAPRRPWVAALASLGFLGWVVSVGGFIARGLDARGRVRGRAAVRWGLAFLISLGTWMVAISLAR